MAIDCFNADYFNNSPVQISVESKFNCKQTVSNSFCRSVACHSVRFFVATHPLDNACLDIARDFDHGARWFTRANRLKLRLQLVVH